MPRRHVIAPVLALLLCACGAGGGPTGRTTPARRSVSVRTQAIAQVDAPVAMAVREGDAAIYVAGQGGRITAIRGGAADPAPVLDLTGQIVSGGEQGLLGIAFSPDGRFLYVNDTDLEGNTNVVEYRVAPDGSADVGSRREVLFVEQPFPNHDGGDLVFGPDGYLYVGLGDGGSGGDPNGNGQNLGVLLGKMLRIEPRLPGGALPPGGAGYAIPPGNPFVHRPGARPEIWAYGLRNPWRYSFDRLTGDLWIGDVGQDSYEEVDVQPASSSGGENYGWNLTEGSHLYGDATAPPAGWSRPLFDEAHDGGNCAIVGGFVYRGSAIPALKGAYVFTDACHGELLAVRQAGGRVTERLDLGARVDSPSSFGEDANGELYVLSLGGSISRLVP